MSGSVNTNSNAMIALESLNATNHDLEVTRKQVSTGFRVADSTDDGAAFAIAQGVRSTVGALTSANQQLGSVKGLLSTTQSALTGISNTMASMRDVLVQLASPATQGNDRTNYTQQYQSLLAVVKNDVQDANYNGSNLIGDISGSSGQNGRVAVVRNESGSSYGITTFSGSALYHALSFTTTQLNSATSTAALIGPSGTFATEQNTLGQGLNAVGSSINYVNTQISYNNNKVDALNSGLGALVDADLAKESAQLTALQIRQQLGTQALSLANQAPQTLLSLFK